jgi:hypothetical protein
VYRKDGCDGLDFDDDFVLDEQIDTVSERDGDVFVDDGERLSSS